ncbi:ABC transporter substrate-binding protein [Halogeometricum limi]|uniref:Peptide/nickel transport system substrate-binding protein n=1 Tax=Halogeometricum limi TaxID=555875 RepID=A0A1I6ITX3_9EURY|nr:ABC transporter substrate-binding protein [Halogeometricum limi]SFR70196.1 peptide/nickel transport system substrate-binding protein [Halogeometricum limi]
MAEESNRVRRRSFLKATTAGGLAGMTALAGCSGGDQSGDGTEGDSAGGDSTETSGGDTTESEGSSSGSSLPTYTYVNNSQSYNPPRHDAINLIARQFNDIGMDVEVDTLEWGTLFNRVSVEYDYSFSTWHTFFTIDPVLELSSTMHSSNTGQGDGNFSGYENPDVDELLDGYMSEPDEQARVDMVHETQKILMEDVPQMPITHMPAAAIYNKNQTGNWQGELSLGFNSYWTMVNLEMKNGEDTLKGYWPETLSTMNVLGHNDENKHTYQFTVMYDTLLRLDNEGQLNPDVSLATDWNRVDETTMEYTIRTDHSWHDGEDLTAEDVAFTYNYIAENEVPLFSVQANYIEGAEVVDDSTVRINMSQALGPFNTMVATQVPIIPQHKWESRSNPSQANIQEPVGSGPLMFDYWNKGSEFGLKKFEDHFAPVSFEQRFWRIIPEASTVWELLKNGELNYEPFGRIDRSLNENQDHEAIGTVFQPATSFWHFTPNQRQDGLDDPVLRKAAVNSIPRTPIVEQILFGFPQKGFNIVSPAFGPLHTEDVTRYEESKEKARSRLEEAGYSWNDNDVLQAPSGN